MSEILLRETETWLSNENTSPTIELRRWHVMSFARPVNERAAVLS